MTNTDNAFVQGMLKQAAAIDRAQEKRAYGKRLTALLQRKGKLPMDTKPTVGVSSFPKQADTFLPWTLLQEHAQEAGEGISGYLQRAGQGVGGLIDKGVGALGRGMDSVRNTVEGAVDKVRDVAGRTEDALFETPMERVLRHGKRDFGRFQESDLGKSIAQFLQDAKDLPKTQPGLTSGLAGAGIGGLAGALTGTSENKETGEKGTRGRNALIGAGLGGAAGLAAHSFAGAPLDKALLQARTSGLTPRPEYTPETSSSNPLQTLKQLGAAPLNVGQNAPPTAMSVKTRF